MPIDDFSLAQDAQDMEHLRLLFAFALSVKSNCIDVGAHAGLRIFDLDDNGPYSLEDFSRSFELGHRWNYVAHV